MPEDRSKQPPAGDDRNLVIVDDDFVNADTEDRLWLFWERNKSIIIRSSVVICVAVLGSLAYYFWKEAAREEVGREFVACQDEAARRAFASSHVGDPLAAVALLEVADDLKQTGKLADAIKAYDAADKAATQAGDLPALKALRGRARLYSALTRQELGEAGADNALAAVADDPLIPETLRGYAMLTLANTAVSKGDTATATKWLNTMDKRLRAGHIWQTDKNWLVRSEPSLLNSSSPSTAPSGK
jgi:hypothetical protein